MKKGDMKTKQPKQSDFGSRLKLKNKEYTKELRKLQTELCKLQEWVKLNGLRAIVIFEGATVPGKAG